MLQLPASVTEAIAEASSGGFCMIFVSTYKGWHTESSSEMIYRTVNWNEWIVLWAKTEQARPLSIGIKKSEKNETEDSEATW